MNSWLDFGETRLRQHLPIMAYMIAFVVQYATIFDFFIPQASRFARVVQLVIVLCYLAKSVAIKDLALACWGVLVFGCLVFWHVLFCRLSGQHPNFNAILGYLPLLCFVPVAAASLPLQWQLRWLFLATCGYLLLYVGANHYLVSGTAAAAAANDASSGLLNSADDRGTRVYLAALLPSFAALYAYEDDELPLLVRIAVVMLATAAVAISSSRTFGLIFIVFFLLRFIRQINVATICLLVSVFVAVSASHLAGLFFSSWNPYSSMIKDNSSYGRFLEYNQAMSAIRGHWLLGLGIEPDSDAMGIYLNVPRYLGTIFWSDLGALGPLGQFGLPGLAFFLVASVACLFGAMNLSGESGTRTARLNGAVSALDGVIAPSILYPPGCFFTMLLFGMWLRDRRVAMLTLPASSDFPA